MVCRFPSGEACAALSLSGGDHSAKPGHRLEPTIFGRSGEIAVFKGELSHQHKTAGALAILASSVPNADAQDLGAVKKLAVASTFTP
jgi:hypothetical protein